MSTFKTFVAALILLAGFSAAHAAEVVESIVAVVNDEIVTAQDLDDLMSPVVAQFRSLYTGKEFDEKVRQAREEYLKKVIEDRLILSEAKRKQVIVKDPEVDDMMSDVRNKFPSRELFKQSIEEQGLTEKKLWNRFRDQIMMQKLVSYEVRSKVSVSPGEVTEYYKAHPDEFKQGDRVKLQQILIRLGARTDEEAKAFAQKIVAELRAGKPFEETAKTYSEGSEAKDGGEMGWIEKGQLMGQIDEKVFALKAGEITEPIQSTLGYHIFKLTERQALGTRTLDEVRDQIQEILFKQKTRERLESWLANLKKNAYISVR